MYLAGQISRQLNPNRNINKNKKRALERTMRFCVLRSSLKNHPLVSTPTNSQMTQNFFKQERSLRINLLLVLQLQNHSAKQFSRRVHLNAFLSFVFSSILPLSSLRTAVVLSEISEELNFCIFGTSRDCVKWLR